MRSNSTENAEFHVNPSSTLTSPVTGVEEAAFLIRISRCLHTTNSAVSTGRVTGTLLISDKDGSPVNAEFMPVVSLPITNKS